MRPLKLALIRQRYAGDGGAERFVARALSALRAQDVTVTLIARAWSNAGAEAGDRGFEILRCDPFYIGRLWRDWSFARGVCRALVGREFDLVQSHERLSCCDVYRAGDGVHREWLSQRARQLGPLGRWALTLNPYHRYVLAAERALFTGPRLRAVICNSMMVRDEIRRYFDFPQDRLHVIYSGVDIQEFHPRVKDQRTELRQRHGVPPEATLFLFVGSGFERKGMAVLLNAMAALPAAAFLLIVGRDKRQKRFEHYAARLGIAHRVVFAGRRDDVREYYGAADALVLPTLYDPFPNVILEAMACGLPVVTSRKCGAAELIRAGENGFVCDALDQAALTRHMHMLLAAETRAPLGDAARRTVEPLSLEHMSDELMHLYAALTHA